MTSGYAAAEREDGDLREVTGGDAWLTVNWWLLWALHRDSFPVGVPSIRSKRGATKDKLQTKKTIRSKRGTTKKDNNNPLKKGVPQGHKKQSAQKGVPNLGHDRMIRHHEPPLAPFGVLGR